MIGLIGRGEEEAIDNGVKHVNSLKVKSIQKGFAVDLYFFSMFALHLAKMLAHASNWNWKLRSFVICLLQHLRALAHKLLSVVCCHGRYISMHTN